MRPTFRHFISPNKIQINFLCYSDSMGFDWDPDFIVNRACYDNYIIMYTIYGKLWCCQGGQKIAVLPGQSIFLNLHQPHKYYFEKDVPTRIAWMTFNGSPVVQMMQHMSCPLKLNNKEVFTRLLSFFRLSDNPNPDIYKQSEECYSFLLFLLKETDTHIRTPDENERVKTFKSFVWHMISHNLHRNITVDELASLVSLSKYHFTRTFHDSFGMPPIQFILTEKVRHAKHMLINTSNTVLEISEAFGFSSPGYFSKVFKRITGFTPSDYREFGYLHENGAERSRSDNPI